MTHVPGHGASEIFEGIGGPISVHEEVAYAVAHGAALLGARAACVIKTHGLAKAANAVLSSLSAGVTAGMVVVLAEDEQGRRSDNIFDGGRLLDGLELPWTRADSRTAAQAVGDALARSEAGGLPQAVLLSTEALDAEGVAGTAPAAAPRTWRRDIARHLVCPLFAGYQRAVLEQRLAGGSIDAVERPAIPALDALPPAWASTIDDYRVFFDAFRQAPRGFTAGDATLASLFALPPCDAVDAITYYGGAIPLATGAYLAGARDVWAVCGDFSFLAAGALGLLEAARRELPLKVAIFANGRAAATGGQPAPYEDVERVLAGYERFLVPVSDGRDPQAVRAALDEAVQAESMRIVLLRYA